jgi:integrase
MPSVLPPLDAAGRRRSPATMPGFRAGKPPRNNGQRYPADPPTVDEIVAVMRRARHADHGNRLNSLIVVLWRGGLRINEALSLTESDLDRRRGSILIRHGKNDRRREIGIDAWAWSALQPWLIDRAKLPAGPLFCVIIGLPKGTAGRPAPRGLSCTASPSRRGCADGLHHTSCATPTPSSCCTRGSRCR